MRVTALVKSEEHVCCRYRVAAFRAHLHALGHSLTICPWSSGWFLRQVLRPSRGPSDALLIQRKLFPAWQLHLLRRRVRWLIYDFDDSVFLNSSYNPHGQDCPKRFRQFKEMLHAADMVVAGNEFLYDQATTLTDPAKVVLIPTCIDPTRYRLAEHSKARDTVRLAWIGSSSTLRGLERIGDLLDNLGKLHRELQLRIICDRSLGLRHLPVEFRPWSEATEANDLAESDIGISWLPDDRWSEGKCGLKVLQYMAAGLPVIANPVGLHRKLVRHGETGFLVDSPADWQNATAALVRDPPLRRRMGQAGRRLVESEYPVSRGAAAWAEVLGQLETAELDPQMSTDEHR